MGTSNLSPFLFVFGIVAVFYVYKILCRKREEAVLINTRIPYNLPTQHIDSSIQVVIFPEDALPEDTVSLDFPVFSHAVTRTSKTSLSFNGVALLHSNLPIPLLDEGFYFEILCLRLPMNSELVLGLSPRVVTHALRVFGPHSVALNITQGAILTDKGPINYPILAGIQVSDVIGCLVTTSPEVSIIFSRNGVAGHPIPFQVQNEPPHISLTGTLGVHVMYNFGEEEFLYSIVSPPALYTNPPEYSP